MQTMTTQVASNAYSSSGDDSDYLKKPDINTLNGYYLDADTADQEMFAEMRSNLLLVSGDHYNRRQNKIYRRLRDNKDLTEQQKIRLTKNHIQKISKLYANNILSMNPGVGFEPKDENNLHDQKVAQMHHSVWQDAINKYNIGEKMDDWCDSFVNIGEVHVKLFYDPSLGSVKGYEPQVDEQGNPTLNELGEMVPDEGKPVVEGAFVFSEIYGFNMLRPGECKDLREAEWLGERKMSDKTELLRRFKDKPDIEKLIRSDSDETYMVFDPMNGGYKKANKQTMLREYYFRPSLLFPMGYYYITTKEGILDEGELPGGFFPIVSALFDRVPTTPRGRSPIKTMRPYQVEINRAASKMAEHQITLGDDKLLIQNGTKLSAGGSLPGVRGVNYTGAAPTVMQGRSGDQYLNYMNSQITELYQVMMVAEDAQENAGQLDPYVLLFRSAKQKKKFQRYIARFEKFLIEIVELYLNLAKIHLPDDAVIYAAGKNEQVNIPEFRQYPETCYEINIKAQADDIETKLGKQIVLNHALQYIGPQLGKDDIGKIMRQMPFCNFDQSFDDITMDYDSSVNDVLALDRGEQPPINQYDNHVYMIKRLTMRMRKPDFKALSPQIQQVYAMKVQMHQQFAAKAAMEIQRAEAGFIPTGGALINVDFYVESPNSEGGVKTAKAKIPYEAINWLLKQMDAQGTSQKTLQDLNQGSQAQIAQIVNSQNQVPGQQQQPQGAIPQLAM
jgi:hypothetical protein